MSVHSIFPFHLGDTDAVVGIPMRFALLLGLHMLGMARPVANALHIAPIEHRDAKAIGIAQRFGTDETIEFDSFGIEFLVHLGVAIIYIGALRREDNREIGWGRGLTNRHGEGVEGLRS